MSRKIAPVFLGRGTYGSVYRPYPIWCPPIRHLTPPNDFIGKISQQASSTLDSYKRTQRTRRAVDPNGRFTVPFQGWCRKNKHNDRSHFWGVKGDIEYIFRYGGLSLEKLKPSYDNIRRDEQCRALFFHAFRALIHGLRDMGARGYIHADIKPENLVYNPETNVVRLIDFDLLTPLKGAPAHFRSYGVVYYAWAPEINFVYGNPAIRKNPAAITASLSEISKRVPPVLGLVPAIVSFVGSRHLDEKRIDFRKVDLFSLGLVFLEIFGMSDKRVLNLAVLMTTPDPVRRISPNELVRLFDKIDAENRQKFHF